jgi:hypothetical protein
VLFFDLIFWNGGSTQGKNLLLPHLVSLPLPLRPALEQPSSAAATVRLSPSVSPSPLSVLVDRAAAVVPGALRWGRRRRGAAGGGAGRSAAASGGRRAASRAPAAAARWGLFPLPHSLLLLFS